MLLFEQGTFLLDNSMKIVGLEYISDCLGCDRSRDNVVDKVSSLNSIIKLSSGDLSNNCLFISRRKFGWLSSLVVFFVSIHLLLDPTNGRLPYTSFGLYLMQGIPFLKKRSDGRVMGRRYRFHDVVEEKKDV